MSVNIKRVYEDAAPGDGYRILVDRLWPRGVAKAALSMDEWGKNVAPSSDLRKLWHHGEIDDDEFHARYAAELDGNPEITELARRSKEGTVTLLIAAKDVKRSHAHVLVRAINEAQRKL